MKRYTYRVSLALTVLAVLGLPVIAVAQQPSANDVQRAPRISSRDPGVVPSSARAAGAASLRAAAAGD
jgi:hypothetical protein